MRTSRLLVAVLAVGFAAASTAAASASTGTKTKPQVRDAAGDWKVASQDILDATVTATAKQISGDLHLSAPPASGIRGDYDVIIYVGCTPYALHYTWNGGLSGSTATLDQYACSKGDIVANGIGNTQPTSSTPATATLTATGLRIVAAPTKTLHRGLRVFAAAETRLEPVVVLTGLNTNNPSYGGDIGSGNGYFTLGS